MSNQMYVLMAAAFLCFAAESPLALSAADSFRLRQLYSNQDGNWQFVELEEVPNSNVDTMFYQFAGLALSVTNRHGVTKQFIFPNDLPNGLPARTRHVTIVSQQLAQAVSYSPPFFPDFVMPNQFLPTDGGTIDFAGIDRWTFDPLPTLWSGLLRSADSVLVTPGLPLMQNLAGRQVYPLGGFTTVYEYYDVGADHYFMSGSQPDIDALDTGRIPGWQRTGELFYAPSAPDSYQVPVCRYYVPPVSHFFSASAAECDAAARQYPGLMLETSVAFAAWLPDPLTGACPAAEYNGIPAPPTLVPLYRLWNNRADTNHRYTTSLNVRQQMIEQGWAPEGYGSDGVAMCVLDTLDF